ncbi:hypothetical protein LCGC14_1411300 [marine sediment metagenome]|uniref:Uncharacterized protein n=1 Tax=marine sediment metagenome TaxID=412755 RepID=A0A0F9MVW5_9ZZZZ
MGNVGRAMSIRSIAITLHPFDHLEAHVDQYVKIGEKLALVRIEYHHEPTFNEKTPERLGDIAAFHLFDDIELYGQRFCRAVIIAE